MAFREKYKDYEFKVLEHKVQLTIREYPFRPLVYNIGTDLIVVDISLNVDEEKLSYLIDILSVDMIYNKYFSDIFKTSWIEVMGNHLKEANLLSNKLYDEIIERVDKYELEVRR